MTDFFRTKDFRRKVMDLLQLHYLIVMFLSVLVCVSGDATGHVHFSAMAHERDVEHAYKHRLLAEKTYKNANYSIMFIPSENNAPLVVRVGVGLRKILEVEEFKQLVKVSIWVREYWNDYRLRWDPAEYDNMTAIRVAHGAVWTPDLMLYTNGGQDEEPLKHINVIVTHHGDVTYMYPALHSVACHMEIRFFPFDEQSCDIELGSWSYDADSMDLRLKTGVAAEYSDYDDNTGWQLISFTAKEQNKSFSSEVTHYKTAVFKMVIRRYWTIHFFYMLIPILLIQLLSIMQFLLPCDSVEKVVLGVSIYLSMIIYLLMVSEILPSTKDIPHIVEYIVSTLCLVGTGEAITIVVLMIHHMGQHDNHYMLPQWARVFFLHWCAWFIGMSKYITYDKEHLARITKKTRDPLIAHDSSSSEEEVKEETKEERRASSLVVSMGNVLRRLSRGGSLKAKKSTKKGRNTSTGGRNTPSEGRNTPSEGRNTPSESRNAPSEGGNTPVSGSQNDQISPGAGSQKYQTPPTDGSQTSGFSPIAGSPKDQKSPIDTSPKGQASPAGGSQTSRNTPTGGIKIPTKGRNTPPGAKKTPTGSKTRTGKKTPTGNRKTQSGGRKTPTGGRNTPTSGSQKGLNTPTTGSQKGQTSPPLGSRHSSSTKSASIQLHTSYLNLSPPDSDVNESNSNNVDSDNTNVNGPVKDPPHSNDNDPQAEIEDNPQQGDEKLGAAPYGPTAEMQELMEDTTERLCHVLSGNQECESDKVCEHCHTRCQPCYASIDPKLDSNVRQRRLERGEYAYRVCCCTCMNEAIAQRQWSRQLTPIGNHADLKPPSLGTVSSSESKRNTVSPKGSKWLKVKSHLLHAKPENSSILTVSSSDSKKTTVTPKESNWLKVKSHLLHAKHEESSILTVSSSESKTPKESNWLKVKSHLLHANHDELSKSNEHLSARQRRLNEEMHKAQTGRLSFDYHKVDKKSTKEYLLLKIYKKLVEHKDRLSDEDMEAEIRCEWQQVAMVLDRLMFFIYLIGTIAIIARMYNSRPDYTEQNIHLPNEDTSHHSVDDGHLHINMFGGT